MKRICAWCKKDIGQKGEYASEGVITHGICSLCAIDITKNAPRTAREILNILQEPVYIIDPDGVVKAANKSGQEMLGKDAAEIENQLGGDAFECSYSKLDGGCGNTVHCKTCAIRNTVMDTLSTGEGYNNVPAFQSIQTKDGAKILKFFISTEKVGERILLRIDRVANSG